MCIYFTYGWSRESNDLSCRCKRYALPPELQDKISVCLVIFVICCPGRVLHVYPADTHRCTDPGVHLEPTDGVYSPLQPLLQTVRVHTHTHTLGSCSVWRTVLQQKMKICVPIGHIVHLGGTTVSKRFLPPEDDPGLLFCTSAPHARCWKNIVKW